MKVADDAAQQGATVAGTRPSRYLLLVGAKINGGDFLIRQRCVELLSALKPGAELRVQDRWKPLDAAVANWADAVLLCGGPALQPAVYPDIYPLTPSLTDIEPSIIGLGLGWKGVPGDRWTERTYDFTAGGRRLIERLVRNGRSLSCRDPATQRVLSACGVHDTVMTGDPAWFDLPWVGARFEPPARVHALLVSMPATPTFFRQAVELLRALRRRVAGPLIASFNHGWTPGEHVGAQRAAAYARLHDAVTDLGVQAVDVSGDVQGMLDLGAACDIHLGYRLHTHLLFLSRRKPTLLIEEDGRGSGAGEALGLPGIRAWVRPKPSRTLLPVVSAMGRIGRPVQQRMQARIRADDLAVTRALAALDRHQDEAFSEFVGVARRMEHTYHDRMRPFVESLP